jgi:hypothetical protein
MYQALKSWPRNRTELFICSRGYDQSKASSHNLRTTFKDHLDCYPAAPRRDFLIGTHCGWCGLATPNGDADQCSPFSPEPCSR